jgi:hypothetical protein
MKNLIITAAILSSPLVAQASATKSLIYFATQSALLESGSNQNFAGQLKLAKNEAHIVLFQAITSSEMTTPSFHCRAEIAASGETQGATCQDSGKGPRKPHQLGSAVLKRDDFLASIADALSIFDSRIAKLDTITELKFWQHGDDLTIRVTGGVPTATSLFSCHQHGAAYDCHRTRRPGPNEPTE